MGCIKGDARGLDTKGLDYGSCNLHITPIQTICRPGVASKC